MLNPNPNPPRTWAMHLSDSWFYLRHPGLFYEEIYLHWRAERVGQEIRWL